MTWNTPKPGEWKSEELSQGRIIDYKAFNFVDGEGVRNSLYVAGCMFVPFRQTERPGLSMQAFLIPKS